MGRGFFLKLFQDPLRASSGIELILSGAFNSYDCKKGFLPVALNLSAGEIMVPAFKGCLVPS